MDGLSIYKAVNILNDRYISEKLTRVTVTEDSVCIGIYSKDRISLFVRVTGGKPSVHTVREQAGISDKFLDRINGGEIKEIGCRKFDRVFWLDIEKRRPSGKMETHRLVFELIGKMANAMLLNEESRIIWMFCKNNADADRQTGLGQQYQMPKSNKSQTLEKYTSENFADLLGFYPVTVKHAEKYIENNYSFAETAVLIKESLEADDEFYMDNAGKLIPFKPFEGGSAVVFDKIADIQAPVIKAKKDESIRRRLERYFEKQAEKYLALKDKLKLELEEALRFEQTAAKAELIKSNMHKLKDAEGTVELDEYTSEGVRKAAYDIPDGFDAAAEVKKLYKRAEKQKRSVPLLKSRIEEVDNNIDSSLEQLYFTSISEDNELRELAAEMKKNAPKQQKKQTSQKQFEKIQIGEGTAYIGRNSVSNHRLVFQFANPSDWWFHAQKIPSAHLIFRKDGRITQEEINHCASIVAGLSKASHDLKVTVDYTQKKHVKKPKNTPPGFVIYHRFFSVTVEPVFLDEKITGDR